MNIKQNSQTAYVQCFASSGTAGSLTDLPSPCRENLQPRFRQRRGLPFAHALHREVLDCFVEQSIKIQLRAQMQEYRPETDRGAIHEDEFARHRYRPFCFERLVHAKCFAAAVFGRRNAVSDRTHPVVEQWCVDKARPDIERLNEVARQIAKTPGLVGMDDQVVLAAQKAVIKIDDAAHEFRRENTDAAVVQEIDPGRRAVEHAYGVIAKMWIAVDHAETAEREPPSSEHRLRQRVARAKWVALVRQHARAVEPIEREQPSGRQFGPGARHADGLDAVEHLAIERDVFGFATVIELLAHARADFLADLARIDCPIEPAANR